MPLLDSAGIGHIPVGIQRAVSAAGRTAHQQCAAGHCPCAVGIHTVTGGVDVDIAAGNGHGVGATVCAAGVQSVIGGIQNPYLAAADVHFRL